MQTILRQRSSKSATAVAFWALLLGACASNGSVESCRDCQSAGVGGSASATGGDSAAGAQNTARDNPASHAGGTRPTRPAEPDSLDPEPGGAPALGGAGAGEPGVSETAGSRTAGASASLGGGAAGGDGSLSAEPETGLPDSGVGGSAPVSSRFRSVPVGSTEANLGYWEYLPPNYGKETAPLLLFTHGASWQGEGTEESLQKLLEVGPPNLIGSDLWPQERPFIVLAPQNPRSGCFDPGDIDAFIRMAVETYDVDLARIYHTGQSCGAIGAWGYLAEHLDEFVTAAVLISGDGRAAFETAGCALGRVAIWGLHNELDGSVPSAGSVEPLSSLMACDAVREVKLTIYPGETPHDAWTKTYDLSAGNDIYSWMLSHARP